MSKREELKEFIGVRNNSLPSFDKDELKEFLGGMIVFGFPLVLVVIGLME